MSISIGRRILPVAASVVLQFIVHAQTSAPTSLPTESGDAARSMAAARRAAARLENEAVRDRLWEVVQSTLAMEPSLLTDRDRCRVESATAWLAQFVWQEKPSAILAKIATVDPKRAWPRLLLELEFLEATAISSMGTAGDGVATTIHRKSYVQPIADWAVVGPFSNERGAGFSTANDCEKNFDAAARFDGKDRKVAWRRPVGVPGNDGYLDWDVLLEPASQAIGYAACAIEAEKETDILLNIGVSGGYRVFLNGAEVAVADVVRRNDAISESRPIVLVPGWNLLVVKVCAQDDAAHSRFILSDPKGNPFRPLRISSEFEHLAAAAMQKPSERPPLPYVDAFVALDERVRQGTASLEEIFDWGRLLLDRRSDPKEAFAALPVVEKATAQFANDPTVWLLLAAMLKRENGIDADRDDTVRLDALKRALAIDPEFAPALRELAQHDLLESPFFMRARGYIDRLLAINPHHADTIVLDVKWIQKKFGTVAAERRLLEAEASAQPKDYLATWRMQYLTSLDRFAEARALAPRAASYGESNPAFLSARTELARALGEPLDDLLLRAIAVNPFDMQARLELFEIECGRDRRDVAQRRIDEALAIAPDDPAVLSVAIAEARRQDNAPRAIALLDRILEVNPTDAWARRYRTFLDKNTRPFEDDLPWDVAAAVKAAPDAASNPENAPYRLLWNERAIYLNDDGTTLVLHRRLIQILNDAGVRAFDRIPLRGTGSIVRAKTGRLWKKDGSSVEATITATTIDPPPLSPGDIVEASWRSDDFDQSFFGSYFGLVHSFLSDDLVACKRSVLRIIASKSRSLHWRPRNGAPEPETSDFGADRSIMTWTVENLSHVDPEPGMPGAIEFAPSVQVSTYGSWDEFAAWWWTLIKDQFTTTDAMKNTAIRLTRDASTHMEKIRRIYDFVTTEVRYVAWEFGVHGYKPYRADAIFERRFGDCKDKAILLSTMLGSIGIDCRPVLIRLDLPRSEEDISLPVVGHFNHCIAYVPASDGDPAIFLDGTAQNYPADLLPEADRSAEVVVVRDGKAERQTTKGFDAEESHLSIELDGRLDSDGTVSARMTATGTGFHAPALRGLFETAADRKRNAEEWIGGTFGKSAVGEPKVEGLSAVTSPVELEVNAVLEGIASVGQDGITVKMVPQGGANAQIVAKDSRRFDLLMAPPDVQSTVMRLELPDGTVVARKPEPVKIETEFGRFLLEGRVEGRKLIITRLLSIKVPRITSAQYPAFREFMQTIDRADGEVIILRKADR